MLFGLEVRPFIFGDIWRLKGPYISNFFIIVGQVFYLEENYSLGGVLSGGGNLLPLCFVLCRSEFKVQHASTDKLSNVYATLKL